MSLVFVTRVIVGASLVILAGVLLGLLAPCTPTATAVTAAATAAAAACGLLPVSIIGLAFAFILQDLVSRSDLLELIQGRLVLVADPVRVVELSQSEEAVLDL
uniref:Uncharacterized protein n=1 Tax=Strombidium inclinatum TaxID=197538 RepID=A0A7S3IG54_9SPIT